MDSIAEKLEEELQRTEPFIGDDGFSESVLSRLPRKRFSRARSRNWTLASAAAMGSFLTLLLAPPIETAFSLQKITSGNLVTLMSAFLLITILVVPVVWLLYSQLAFNVRAILIDRCRKFRGDWIRF